MTSSRKGSELKTRHDRGGLSAVRHVAIALAAVIVASLILVAGAEAGEVHIPTGTIGQSGTGNGRLSLTEHSGVAVNATTGDIYVSDTGNHRVEEFEADGVFVRTFSPAGISGFSPTSIAIDNSGGPDNGDIYVADSSTNSVFKFEADGTQVTEWAPKSGGGFDGKLTFTKVIQIATGPNGELWVDSEPGVTLPLESTYRRYDTSGTLVVQWEYSPANGGLAVGSEGSLYVGFGPSSAAKISSSGIQIGERLMGGIVGVSTDPENNDLYLLGKEEQYEVRSYGADCGVTCRNENIIDSFGRGELSSPQSIAVGPTHVAYIADASTSKILVYGTEVVEPPTIVGPVEITEVTGNTAHVSGVINPHAPAGEPTTYEVEWYFECLPSHKPGEDVGQVGFRCGHGNGVGGKLPADSAEHTVEGTATVFSPLTEYEVRLVARNRGGASEAAAALTTTALPPTVESVFVTGVSASGATLNVEGLNPEGAETEYYFEYATEAEGLGGSGTNLTPTDTLAAGIVGQQASTAVTGLEPSTSYVYRLVANNQGGQVESAAGTFSTQGPSLLPAGECPNEPFRAITGAALPDCRAYELASPVDKSGLNVEGFPDLLAAAADPNGEEPVVTFYSQAFSGIPAVGGHQEFSSLLSALRDGSWSTQRMSPPEELAGERVNYLGGSPNLHYALVVAGSKSADEMKLLLIDTVTESVTPIVTVKSQFAGAFAVDAIADDGSWVLFESEVQLTTSVLGASGKSNLYLWNATTDQISLVGVRPTKSGEKEKTLPGGSFGGAYEWETGKLSEGGGLADLYVEAVHAATANGDQIYLTAGETGQIYLRRGLTGSHPTTVQVSKPATGAPAEEKEQPAAFQEATPDGSYAFFISAEKLTGAATTGTEDEGKDLYRFDEATESLVDVTPDPAEEGSGGARVQGLLGTSSDGSSGYFAAKGALASGATAGANNVYRFEEEAGGGFHLAFVATLGDGTDSTNWSPTSYAARAIANYQGKSSRVTPDAGELVFTSAASITGYDNRGCGEEAKPHEPCNEIFMYTAATGKVVCISCDPTGSRPAGEAALTPAYLNAHLVPTVAPEAQLTRNLSEDGDRLFFQTPDSLVSGDKNGPECRYLIHAFAHPREDPSCLDVYEWEAPGTPGGSCTKAEVNGGCLYLLSSGTSEEPSYFVDASSEGQDVFIATLSQLVPIDHDESFDIYDAHVDGGLAYQQAEPVVACGSAEACRGANGPAPTSSSPATATFEGPGNTKQVTKPACHKGVKKCKKNKKGKKNKKNKKGKKKGKGKKKSPHQGSTKGASK